MFAPPSNPFTPPEADIPGIIDDLSSSIYTLGDIASRYDTTIEALAHWMARPDIAARIDIFEAAIARRARLQAAATLPSAISAAARILADFESESAHLPVNPKSIRDLERRTRSASVARAAASLITRLARGVSGATAGGGRSVFAQASSAGVQASPPRIASPRPLPSWPASGDDRCEGRSVLASPSKVFPLLTAPWADEPIGAHAFIINHLLRSVGLTISAHQRAPP